MQMKINIEKKHVYFLTALIILFIGITYAIAYGGTSPATMGHSAGEIDFNTDITVAGKVQATNFIGDGSQLTGISSNQWTTSGNNVYYNSGNVGIGTTNPQSKLQIEGQSVGASMVIQNTAGGGFRLYSYDNNGGARFRVWDGATEDFNDELVIRSNGNVGIGTANPSSKLEVNGMITSGLYAAPGASYMQFYVDPSSSGYRFRKGTLASSTDLLQIMATGDVGILGSLSVGGVKNFVQAHPTDPTKEIVYTSIEAGEVRTLLTGSAKLNNGEAAISLPEHFSSVTNNEGLTAVVAPTQESNGLYVSYKDSKKLIVKEINNGNSDATFDYIITGIRTGYEDKEIIRDKE